MKTYTKILLCICLLAVVLPLSANTTYVVTNTGDNNGVNPAPHAATGTLRQAIVDSNADGGVQNIIAFDIPGTGPFVISVATQLPTITSNVDIDGFSQPGAMPNTNLPDQGGLNAQLMIEIDGGGTIGNGLYINGSNAAVTLSGLVIDGFATVAIDQASNGTLLVYGCFVGTQIDGTAFVSGFGNNGIAVRIDAGHANIGGVLPGQGNLISGDRAGGILLGPSVSAVIEGNLVGTDASGALPIGSGSSSNWPAIIVPGNVSGVRIGCGGTSCTAAGSPSRNVISGNHDFGIGIWNSFGTGSSGGLEIKGNFIGTDWSGTRPLPNGDAVAGCPAFCGGIQLQNTAAGPTTIIGGFDPGEGNLIAFNHGPGIIPVQNQAQQQFRQRSQRHPQQRERRHRYRSCRSNAQRCRRRRFGFQQCAELSGDSVSERVERKPDRDVRRRFDDNTFELSTTHRLLHRHRWRQRRVPRQRFISRNERAARAVGIVASAGRRAIAIRHRGDSHGCERLHERVFGRSRIRPNIRRRFRTLTRRDSACHMTMQNKGALRLAAAGGVPRLTYLSDIK